MEQTSLKLNVAEDWPTPSRGVRRIGWLDQYGRVYAEVPPMQGFDGGSLTPLLIPLDE